MSKESLIESMRRFARLELREDALPDETTILKFRHLLERQGLTARMMETINTVLSQRGLLLFGGTRVDATIIHAASSTKNKARERDPERHHEKQRDIWEGIGAIFVGWGDWAGLGGIGRDWFCN
jgi:IS5 family transposase